MKDLEAKTEYILREVKSRFKNPAVLWSKGKQYDVMRQKSGANWHT